MKVLKGSNREVEESENVMAHSKSSSELNELLIRVKVMPTEQNWIQPSREQ